ncbi:MAG: hypothetical protein ACK5OX_00110 [Desertimonas sp.]
MPHVPTPEGLVERASALRSPFLRAVVPVAGGAVLLAAIFGVTWLIAVFISGGGADSTERLAPSVFEVGGVEALAGEVADNGPLLLRGFDPATDGERSIVVDHEGSDPMRGWRVYWAHPADRAPGCLVEQEPGTDRFTDCDGRDVGVGGLEPAAGVLPVVEDRATLTIDLRGSLAEQVAATPTSG